MAWAKNIKTILYSSFALDWRGTLELCYAWPLVFQTNNHAEDNVLLHGLALAYEANSFLNGKLKILVSLYLSLLWD